jgi:hypothetical protein
MKVEWKANQSLFEENLAQAIMVYEQLLEDNDMLSQEEFDLRLKSFKDKIENQNWSQYWTRSSDLEAFDPLHEEERDFDPEQLGGSIIVIKNNDKRFVIDGNHRRAFLLRKYPNLKCLVTEIEIQDPRLC